MNNKIRETSEAIYTKYNHFDIIEMMTKGVCKCSNELNGEYNLDNPMVLCEKHEKTYREEISRIAKIIEGVVDKLPIKSKAQIANEKEIGHMMGGSHGKDTNVLP